MRAYLTAIILAVCFLFAGAVSAQNVADHVKVSKTPDWVKVLPQPSGIFEAAQDLKIGYRIVDYQNKVDP